MNDYSQFLKSVEAFSDKYASIFVNCELEPLTMRFWSWQEIQDGLNLRLDWEVDTALIPFYGDWHDLLCLNGVSGEIVALDDNRQVVCQWASIDDFVRCLSEKEVHYDDKMHQFTSSPDGGESADLKTKH